MKLLSFITILLLASNVLAQQWRTSFDEGNKLFEEGKYNEAYDKFVEAQKTAPEEIDFSKEISKSAYRKGDYQEAQESYFNQQLSAETPQEKAALYHNIGNCNMAEKNYAEAVENYKNALRLDPSDEQTRYNLAEAKRRLKKQEDQQQKQQEKQQQDQQQQEDQQQNDQQQNDQQQGDQNHQNQQNQQNQQGQQQGGEGQQNKNQQQSNSSSSEGQPSNQQRDKLNSKKTDRILDELLKQEMKTKRKLRGMHGGGKQEQVKSGKRW